jgi:hypothetical protein
MKISKHNKRKYTLQLAFFFSLLLLFFLFYCYSVWKKKDNSSLGRKQTYEENQNTPQPTPNTRTLNVVIKNGVYTDYDNGFIFHYPTDFFVFATENGYLRNTETFETKTFFEDESSYVELYVGTSPINDFDKTLIDLKKGQKLEKFALTKLTDLETKNMSGYVYFQDNTLIGQGPRHYTYHAAWVKKGAEYTKIYYFNMKIYKNDPEKYKPIFDQIVSSFRLIN